MNEHPIALLDKVSGWLEQAGIQVVYTGGTTVPLYLGPIAAVEFRQTRDVDCIVDALDYPAYAALTRRLREAGFLESQEDDAPMCRFVREGVSVDVMPINEGILGFSNRWYRGAWENSTLMRLPSGRYVPVFRIEYLLASKIAAYESRGGADPYMSHDFEDVVSLLDAAEGSLDSVDAAAPELRDFVHQWLSSILSRDDAYDLMAAHVSRAAGGSDRAELLLMRLQTWVRGDR